MRPHDFWPRILGTGACSVWPNQSEAAKCNPCHGAARKNRESMEVGVGCRTGHFQDRASAPARFVPNPASGKDALALARDSPGISRCIRTLSSNGVSLVRVDGQRALAMKIRVRAPKPAFPFPASSAFEALRRSIEFAANEGPGRQENGCKIWR